jgi:hypothetical protein
VALTDGFMTYQAHLSEKQMLLCAVSGSATRFEAAYSVKTKQWNGLTTLVLNIKELHAA